MLRCTLDMISMMSSSSEQSSSSSRNICCLPNMKASCLRTTLVERDNGYQWLYHYHINIRHSSCMIQYCTCVCASHHGDGICVPRLYQMVGWYYPGVYILSYQLRHHTHTQTHTHTHTQTQTHTNTHKHTHTNTHTQPHTHTHTHVTYKHSRLCPAVCMS